MKSTKCRKNVFKTLENERNFQANLKEYGIDRCSRPNTVAVLCCVTEQKTGMTKNPTASENNAGITGETGSIIKFKVQHPRLSGSFYNSRRDLVVNARKLREQRRGKRPNRSRSLTNRKRKNYSDRTACLEEASCGCSLTTLAHEDGKNIPNKS